MNRLERDVREFMKATGQPTPEHADPDSVPLQMRANLLLEECLETVEALGFSLVVDEQYPPTFALRKVREPDWPEVIDGVCDVVYVAIGLLVTLGVNIGPYWHEVQRSNMAKVGGPIRDDGKLLKPEGWKPPRIKYLWGRALERAKGAV